MRLNTNFVPNKKRIRLILISLLSIGIIILVLSLLREPQTTPPSSAAELQLMEMLPDGTGQVTPLREDLSIFSPGKEDVSTGLDGMPVLRNVLVIGLKNPEDTQLPQEIAASYKAQIIANNNLIGQYSLRFPKQTNIARIKEDLSHHLELIYVMEDHFYSPTSAYPPNDPWNDGFLDGLHNPNSWDESDPSGRNWGQEAVRALSAWRFMEGKRKSPVIIGVIDGPAERNHPELSGLIRVPDVVFDGARENSTINDWFEIPKELTEEKKELTEEERKKRETLLNKWLELINHGTHVSGIIGACANNHQGIAGIVQDADILTIPRLPTTSQLITYMTLMLDKQKPTVFNFSFGRNFNDRFEDGKRIPGPKPCISEDERNACIAALLRFLENGYDFLVVQSAGNGKKHYNDKEEYWYEALDPLYNGFFASIRNEDIIALFKAHNYQGTITVQDIAGRILIVANAKRNPDGNYQLDATSGCGETVDMAAPGTDIYSCIRNGKYNYMSGTSMAAPFVTGIAVNAWSLAPNLNGAQIGKIMQDASITQVHDNPDNNHSTTMSTVLIDAMRAVEMAYKSSGTQNQVSSGISTLGDQDLGGVESILSFVLSGLDLAYFRLENPDLYNVPPLPKKDQEAALKGIMYFDGPPEALHQYAKEECIRQLADFDTEFPYLQMDESERPENRPPPTPLTLVDRQIDYSDIVFYKVSLPAELLNQVLRTSFSFSLPGNLINPADNRYHYVMATGIGVPPSFEIIRTTRVIDTLTVDGRLIDEVIYRRSSPPSMPAPIPFRATFIKDEYSWANGWRLTWLTLNSQP
jgi:subtilisin family serine protease